MYTFYDLWQMLRSAFQYGSLKTSISDERCVSCGSKKIDPQGGSAGGGGAYVCRRCGYEGGSARQGQRLAQRREVRRHLPVERHQEEVFRLLGEAKLHLTSSLGAFELARAASRRDMMDPGLGLAQYADGDKQSQLVLALGDVMQGRDHLNAACELLAHDADARGGDVWASEILLWTADIHMDGLLVDGAMHLRIRHAEKQARQLLEAVERLWVERFPPEVVAQLRQAQERRRVLAIARPQACDACEVMYDVSQLNLTGHGAVCDRCLHRDALDDVPDDAPDDAPTEPVSRLAVALMAGVLVGAAVLILRVQGGAGQDSLPGLLFSAVGAALGLFGALRVAFTRDRGSSARAFAYLFFFVGVLFVGLVTGYLSLSPLSRPLLP